MLSLKSYLVVGRHGRFRYYNSTYSANLSVRVSDPPNKVGKLGNYLLAVFTGRSYIQHLDCEFDKGIL